jgi:nucleotide-binding universal stress UspA family protein
METILIATDFSEASRNASFYGTKLAKLLGAKVVLVNAYPYQMPTSGTLISMTNEELRHSSRQNLKHEVGWLDLKGEVEIEKHNVQGDAVEVILSEARRLKATWIVAGMKGAGRMARKMFGGVAFSLSRLSEIPLILVPQNAWFTPPTTIALASDIDHNSDMRILDPLEEFGKKCHSTMYVVRVIKRGMDELVERLLRPNRIKWHCRELHPSFEFLNDNDVAAAMNHFVKEHKVDMIAMILQDHNLFDRLFSKSDIQEMMMLTTIPLILLPGKIHPEITNEIGENISKRSA